MKHDLKLNQIYVDRIVSGQKVFDVRINDRDYQIGDAIEYSIVNENGVQIDGGKISTIYQIKYIHSGLGMKENYVVLGI